MKCNLCPRKCNIDRAVQPGFCGAPKNLKVAKVGLHFWEEPVISGTRGSGTVFFSGCNLDCVFCQNYELSHEIVGKEITVQRLADIFKEQEKKGAHNINLVTPSHYVDKIIEALDIYKPNIPVVYNTNGYDTVENIQKLKGYVDIYLPDFKYVSSELSGKYSGAKNYFEVASASIREMLNQQPVNEFDENGMMTKGVIIRHMVLPGCMSDSCQVLDYIKDNFGADTYVSVMSQYTPGLYLKNYPEIDRKLKPLEYKYVINHFIKIGLKNGFYQDLTSASAEYIPPFDLEGV